MLSDAVKLFEILLDSLERGQDVQAKFFSNQIEPLYIGMQKVYADYIDAYRELSAMCGADFKNPTRGKLAEFLRDRELVLKPLRIQTISLSERLNESRALKRFNDEQRACILEFGEAVRAFFELDPQYDMIRSAATGSFYFKLIHGACNGVVEAKYRIDVDTEFDDNDFRWRPHDYRQQIQASANYLLNEVLESRWIRLSNAFARAKSLLP